MSACPNASTTNEGATFLAKHAVWSDASHVYLCKKTGAHIQTVCTGRTIRDGCFPLSGGGEVRMLHHPWCPKCGTKPSIQYGDPL
jgi:hypothetical protein